MKFNPSVINSSDWHLYGLDDRLDIVEAYCAMVEDEAPLYHIVNGDWGDTWKGEVRDNPWEEICVSKSWQRFQRLAQHRHYQGLYNVWTLGNHDSSAKTVYMPYTNVVRSFTLRSHQLFGNNLAHEFRHGWEFDIAWNGWGFIPGVTHRIAFWLAEHHPKLALRLWYLLHGKESAGSTKRVILSSNDVKWRERTRVNWMYHVGVMRLRALDYAIKNNIVLTMGHTHTPEDVSGIVYDSGDFENDFTYLSFYPNDIVDIKVVEV